MGWVNLPLKLVVPLSLYPVRTLLSDPLSTKSACLKWEKAQQNQVCFLLGYRAELAHWEIRQVLEPAQKGGSGTVWLKLSGGRGRREMAESSSSKILGHCSLLLAFNLRVWCECAWALFWLLAGNAKYTKRKSIVHQVVFLDNTWSISGAHRYCGASVLSVFHSCCDKHCAS